LEESAGFNSLESRDRAFARLLAATALRREGEIDAVLGRLIERPLPKGAVVVRDILALGIVQLIFLGTPAHAAVATAVEATEALNQRKFKGLVNAVLRRVARERAEQDSRERAGQDSRDGRALLEGIDAARVNTPDWLWREWAAAFGEATASAIAGAHLREAPLDLHPRDPDDAADLAALLDARLLPNGAIRRTTGGAVADLPGYAEGRWWVQDAAAQVPARLLGPVAGKRVLDLCAAPGGKTLQLAVAGASVTAVDQSPARLALVAENLRRTGLTAELVAADARSFRDGPFDAVLLDAPCTATGTIRRHPDIARTRRPQDITAAVLLQDELLDAAARLTRPGGLLVYAVCSLQQAEGEERIAAFLARHPGFAVEPVTAADCPGMTEAVADGGYFRSLPSMMAEAGGMDGFFAARLRRSGEAAT
ncbi:MAG: S-adenosyl-methionine (AdoMet)-dependent m5C methyltransferase, partial [Pseudomonadota bacterium]